MNPTDFVPPAYLVMTNVDPADWCAPFTRERKVIGRHVDADIPIPQRFALVSRKHGEIWVDQNTLKVKDLGSKSGTHVNGVWLIQGKETTVVIGDRIWMGEVELQVVDQVPLIAQVLAESAVTGDEEITRVAKMTQQEMPAGDDPLARSTEFGNRKFVAPIRTLLAELSNAELEVVLWMGRGYLDDQELGQKLFRSPNTIRTHLSNIFRKLNVHSRAEVIGCLRRVR
ncbi:MAG: FHA domain-containing protein [Planctomycetales bacterium]